MRANTAQAKAEIPLFGRLEWGVRVSKLRVSRIGGSCCLWAFGNAIHELGSPLGAAALTNLSTAVVGMSFGWVSINLIFSFF
jgi:hypothetical protein